MAENNNKRKFYQQRNFRKFQEKKSYATGAEFGRAGRDLLYKYGLSGENPDNLIASKGMSHLDDIERDTHLSSALATRRAKLIQKGWRIIPASDDKVDGMIADFVYQQLINMTGSFEKDIEAMLTCIGRGFSITEKNFQLVDWQGEQLVGLKSLRWKDPKLFSFKFDALGHYQIVQIDPDPAGVLLPSDKFIHIISGPDDENPYGKAASAECAFWVWVKKNVAKFWAIFAEKFGMPLAMVMIPRNIEPNTSEYQKIEDILTAIQEETGIRVPEGFEVKFLEAMRNGEGGYEKFIQMCNSEISKRVFGATLIAEEGKRGQGSYALGSEHAEIFEDYVTFDAAILEAALNEQLIRQLCDFNWELEVYPRFEFIDFAPGIFITFSQSIQNLVNTGLGISANWVYERLRIPKPREGEQVLEVKQVNPFGGMGGQGGQGGGQGGVDNKVEMSDVSKIRKFLETDHAAKDSFKNIDELSARYESLMAAEFSKLGELIKKKSLTAPTS
jgi:phage gp29-like protein